MPDAPPVPVPAPAPIADALPAADDCLTLKQVAKRRNVPVRYVRQLRQSGALPVVPLSARRLRVRPEDLERFILERMARPVRRGAAR